MFLSEIISYLISLLNIVLMVIFGNRYKFLIDKVFNIYVYVSKLMSIQPNNDNSLNDTLIRLGRAEEKITALQNQIVSLQRQMEEMSKKSSVPPPPPPPPPQPTIRTSTLKASKAVKEAELVAEEIETKRAKPSTDELVKRKGQLRTTSMRRSPGGTPLTHWGSPNFDISSPEDNAIASVMKKALKRKFRYLRPVSPPSPIEGSPNENDFSF